MAYRLFADAILVVHAGFIVFVVAGLVAFIVGGWRGWGWVRNPWLRGAHLAAIGIVVLQAWLAIECPLTTWENRLRVAAGQDPYAPEGFIASWLRQLIFFQAPLWVFTLVYTAFGLLVVATLVWVPPRWPAAARAFFKRR